ncbi:MAG: M3 family metallopeptidase [Chloroflexales bacterium]|nr:M3 family metallopeptidase [Chloroflexales bacterium]
MFAAVREAFPDCQRYFRAKARALGVERLAWYDLFAPIGTSATKWDYATATAFFIQQFGTYSDWLSAFAARAFRKQWIDAEPQPGKRAVALCERLLNYRPDFVSMSILAHELGHAYHNFNLINRTALQSHLAETLSETASIFCETIIRQAALQQAEPGEQSAILDASLQGAAQLGISMTSRFLFEQRVFEQRQQRELAISELCALREETQRETYGDGLDPNALQPYLWATKIHYYDPGFSFYNY